MTYLDANIRWTEEDLRQSKVVLDGIERADFTVRPHGSSASDEELREADRRMYLQRIRDGEERLHRLIGKRDGHQG